MEITYTYREFQVNGNTRKSDREHYKILNKHFLSGPIFDLNFPYQDMDNYPIFLKIIKKNRLITVP